MDRMVGFSWHLMKVQCYYSVTNAFQLFLGEVYCGAIETLKIRMP